MLQTEFTSQFKFLDIALIYDQYSKHKKMINDYILYYGKGIEQFKRDGLVNHSSNPCQLLPPLIL